MLEKRNSKVNAIGTDTLDASTEKPKWIEKKLGFPITSQSILSRHVRSERVSTYISKQKAGAWLARR